MEMPVGILALIGIVVLAGGGGTLFGLLRGRKSKSDKSGE